MKFLCDVHISYQLKKHLITLGFESIHVNEILEKSETKDYRLCKYDCKVFYDKLTFIYLEIPKFKKELKDIDNRFEKWLYIIRNLNKLERIPDELREGIFERLFEIAEIAKFSQRKPMSMKIV